VDELPLLELFTRLRESGILIGIQDYEAVLHALQAGYGLAASDATVSDHRSALARLCQTLWVRSAEEQHLLDYHLELFWSSRQAEMKNLASTYAPLIPKEPHDRSNSVTRAELKRNLIRGVFLLFLLYAGWEVYRWQRSVLDLGESTPQIAFQTGFTEGHTVLVLMPGERDQFQNVPVPSGIISLDWGNEIAVFLGLLGCRQISRSLKRSQPNEDKISPSTSQSGMASELPNQTGDKTNISQELQQLQEQPNRLETRFVLSADYLPVKRRQMKQSWRHLRRMIREGVATELDMAATVRQVAHDGILLHPVMIPPRINKTELVLLLDQDGSMVPFHALSLQLAETAQRGGRLRQSRTYYFHNCPVDYLYHDAWHQEAQPTSDVLAQFHRDRTVVLIFSDAGAARSGMNAERVMLTVEFLRRLKRRVNHVTWLNPMPKSRWADTTAGHISRYVPMFEGTRRGLDQAIGVLQGRHSLSI
jgi:uncharacterized protein